MFGKDFPIFRKKEELHLLVRYGVIGVFSVSIDFGIFLGLRELGVPSTHAQALSYFSGTLVSFALNALLNFRVSNGLLRRLLLFVTIALINSLVSSWMLGQIVGAGNANELIVKVLVTGPFLISQYLLNRLITFR